MLISISSWGDTPAHKMKEKSPKTLSRGHKVGVRVLVFNTTFNNNSVISGRSVLLVEETGVLGENH